MTHTMIKFHAEAIERQTAEMKAAQAEGDRQTADMIWDAIRARKQMLKERGVVII